MDELKLEAAFDKMRETQNWEHVLKPFLMANFYVAGAEFPLYDQPVFYARPLQSGGQLTLTVSELKTRIEENPGVTLMKRTGLQLVQEMNRDQCLLILYKTGGELLGTEQLDWFREAVRLDPLLVTADN